MSVMQSSSICLYVLEYAAHLLSGQLTFDLAFRRAFCSVKVPSKSDLSQKSKVISLSERLRPNLWSNLD